MSFGEHIYIYIRTPIKTLTFSSFRNFPRVVRARFGGGMAMHDNITITEQKYVRYYNIIHLVE